MSDIRIFKFCYGDTKIISYDSSKTIESLLNQFLTETNLKKKTLDPEKIQFIHKSHILNLPSQISKAIKEVLKGQHAVFKIHVIDPECYGLTYINDNF